VQRKLFLEHTDTIEICCHETPEKTLTVIAANFWTIKMLVPISPKIYAAKINRQKPIFAGSMSEITFFERFSSKKSFLDIFKMSIFVFAADFFLIFWEIFIFMI